MLDFIKRNAKFVIVTSVSFLIIAGLTTALIMTNTGPARGRHNRDRNRDSSRIERIDRERPQEQNTETEVRGAFTEQRAGRSQRGMTDEQRAERDALYAAWEALTDAQKSEIFNLSDQRADITNQIIEKYLELGLIDAETAERLTEINNSQAENARENDRMPVGIRGSRGHGDNDGRDRSSRNENKDEIKDDINNETREDEEN